MDLGRFETSLAVADIARSLAFYQAMGFRRVDGGVDIRNLTLRRGDCRLSLYQGYLEPAETQLIFWQGKVEAIAKAMIAEGLRFDDGHPKRGADGAAAGMLRDPDGHPLYLVYMPVLHMNDPNHARPAPRYRPTRLKPDKQLGWFELGIAVGDIARSRAFYEKLGFVRVETGPGEDRVTLQNNDCRIVLSPDLPAPERARLIFRQGDVAAVAHGLTSKGLSFERPPAKREDGIVAAVLRDPDGNAIEFISMPGAARTA